MPNIENGTTYMQTSKFTYVSTKINNNKAVDWLCSPNWIDLYGYGRIGLGEI
jgi:hypothetical protein